MTVTRRVLTVMIAVSLALLPMGAAAVSSQAVNHQATVAALPSATHDMASVHHDHGMNAQDHDAMSTAAAAEGHASDHCKGKPAHNNCCDDEGTCTATCLLKCFSAAAVFPTMRAGRPMHVAQFAVFAVEQPPGWSLAPAPPPPRT